MVMKATGNHIFHTHVMNPARMDDGQCLGIVADNESDAAKIAQLAYPLLTTDREVVPTVDKCEDCIDNLSLVLDFAEQGRLISYEVVMAMAKSAALHEQAMAMSEPNPFADQVVMFITDGRLLTGNH